MTPRVPSSSGSPSAIFAAAWLSTLKVPIRFTSITLRKRSSGKPITRAPPPIPAQLTTPCSSSHDSTSERTASSSVTSVSGRSAITTVAPSRSSIAALASPSPERPPVTMNVLPCDLHYAETGSLTNCSRSAVLRNLPTAVFGISSTNS